MQLQVGQVATSSRVFAQRDFDRFAALSGDDNPIQVDAEFSARTHFGKTVCHGMLLYATLCGALDAAWPGIVQVEQELMFPSPTYVGDQVTVRLEVTQVRPEDRLAWISTLIAKPDGTVSCEGKTLVRFPGN